MATIMRFGMIILYAIVIAWAVSMLLHPAPAVPAPPPGKHWVVFS